MFGGDVVNRTRVPRVSTCGFTPGLTYSFPWSTLVTTWVTQLRSESNNLRLSGF